MGFGNTVDHTTLSRANEKRDHRIYEELGYELIEVVRPLYKDEKLDDVDTDLALLALDSTTISVSLKLCNWALGKYSRGDVKMHTLLDLRGGIPVQIHVSDGRWHDSNMLDKLVVEPGAIYAADKAYVDLVALRRVHLSGAFFLLAWVKKAYRSSYTVTEIATLVSVSLFEKTDLNELLTAPDEKHSHLNSNQNVKELTLF